MNVTAAAGTYLLLVEDDPDICETMQVILEERGYLIRVAAEGREALRVLREHGRPFLILLDLMMPGMNGIEFRAEQLRDPDLASIPTIILSGDGALARKSTALGLVALAKPIDLKTLLEVLERHRPGPTP